MWTKSLLMIIFSDTTAFLHGLVLYIQCMPRLTCMHDKRRSRMSFLNLSRKPAALFSQP